MEDLCLADLHVADSHDDKTHIERTGGGLLKDSVLLDPSQPRLQTMARRRVQPTAVGQGRPRQGQDDTSLRHHRRIRPFD